MEWWWNQYSPSSCSLLVGWCYVLYDPWRSLNVWFVRWWSHGKRVRKKKKQNKTIKAVTAHSGEKVFAHSCFGHLWREKNPLMSSSAICFSPLNHNPHLPYCQGKSTKLDSADFIFWEIKKEILSDKWMFFLKVFWNFEDSLRKL